MSTKPGETPLTRIGANSAASGLTRASTVPLMAAMSAVPGIAPRAVIAPSRMMEPSEARRGKGGLDGSDVAPELRVEGAPEHGQVEAGDRACPLAADEGDDQPLDRADRLMMRR